MTRKLTDGLYRLNKDVPNPKPDRRQRNDWRYQTEWPAGMPMVVANREHVVEVDGKEYRTPFLQVHHGQWVHQNFHGDGIPAALLEALEPTEPRNLTEALRAVGLDDWNLSDAVEHLVRQGRLSYQDIVDAALAAEALPSATGGA